MNISTLDRRKFLRGSGIALALPWLESFFSVAQAAKQTAKRKRLACFYLPDGVPMPLEEDPSFKDWSWFPHGKGRDFTFTKCMETLHPLRDHLTVFSGLSHPAVRKVHGHRNADQFLTGADTGAMDDPYQTAFRSIRCLPPRSANTPGMTLWSCRPTAAPVPRAEPTPCLTMPKADPFLPNTSPSASSTCSSSRAARMPSVALPSAKVLSTTSWRNANSLNRSLSKHDQETLADYLQSVRDTERKVEKAKRWLNIPMPDVESDLLKLDVTAEDPRNFLRTMYELIYLAFKTDTTRTATYQLGRENGVGVSDYLSRAVGYRAAHTLSHDTKQPDGYKNFGIYCRFINEELGRFASRLKDTPEPGGGGNMLDNTAILFGSASSAFHLSRNYPMMLMGAKNMGFKHGQYLKYGQGNDKHQATSGISSDSGWRGEMEYTELPLSNLYLTILNKLGVETEGFGGSTETLSEV